MKLFTIIGVIIAVIVVLILIYFAWFGWRAKGEPVPDIDANRQGALVWPLGAART